MKLRICCITLISSLLLLGLGCSPSGSQQTDDTQADDQPVAEAPDEEGEAPSEEQGEAADESEEGAISEEMCEEACMKIVDCDPEIDEDFHAPCVDGCMNEGKVEEVTCFIESDCETILEDACGI